MALDARPGHRSGAADRRGPAATGRKAVSSAREARQMVAAAAGGPLGWADPRGRLLRRRGRLPAGQARRRRGHRIRHGSLLRRPATRRARRGRDRASAGQPGGHPRTRPLDGRLRARSRPVRGGRHRHLGARTRQLRCHRLVRGPRAPPPAGPLPSPRCVGLLRPGGVAYHDYNPFFSLDRRPFAVHARLPVGSCPARPRGRRALPGGAATRRGRPDASLLRREPQPDDARRPAWRDRGGRARDLAVVPWSQRSLVPLLTPDVLREVRQNYPTATIEDLLATFVSVVVRRPA